ncbi:N-acetylneuraminate synthase family protein [uncultured Thalassospira sp.]|uniref:N-acetylneuraminate synthase family protein n=1 Tax=uncultured Thalassospira sp. TaxID=404382 RepID=UPI0032B27EFE
MSYEFDTVIKPWGRYYNLFEAEDVLVKVIVVAPRQALSLQSHEFRAEHWFVRQGTAHVEIDGRVFELNQFCSIDIPLGSTHRLINPSDQVVEVIEIQFGSKLDENDIVRYKDRYGRLLDRKKIFEEKMMSKPMVICEIGCNHRGDLETALDMIRVAAQFCNVDVVKFQKRTNKELLTDKEYNSPHPNPINSYGSTYGEHREFLEFDLEQHRALKNACDEWGVVYSTSVWDLTSAKEIASLEPELIKIPSAINTDMKVMNYLYDEYKGEIHVSLGMTSKEEMNAVVELAEKKGRAKDLILYHCISGYPVEVDELFLLEIKKLKDEFGGRVKGIGFSGHHKGIAADIAALTLGADYFERHFTLDRSWKGTDHAASLEPDGMRRLTRDLKAVIKALEVKPVEILPLEQVQRDKLKKFNNL